MRFRFFVAAALSLGATLSTPRADAAPGIDPSAASSPTGAAAAPAPPPLVPPRAITMPRVPYPEGAQGAAIVIVEIVVDTDGSVQSAKALEGIEPFSAAAVKDAPTWKFSPAKRGEVPVRARIRVRVEFEPPVAIKKRILGDPNEAPSGAPNKAPDGSTPPPKGPAATSQIEQVEVYGAREEVGKTTLGGGEVRQIPGAFGDAFRAIEALPGVTPIISGLPYFYVRGAPPGNVGYFIDGVRVPLLFHLGLGPSVIHPGMVDHVDFYPGGCPVKFGRFAGGILSGEIRPPATETHGEGNVRLIDAGALVESPIGKDLTVLVAGRYSYTAALLSVAAQLTGNNVRLDYWDYQTRINYKISSRDTLSFFAFGSYDYLGATENGVFQDLFKTEFHRIDLRWDRTLQDGHMRLAFTLGYDLTNASSAVGVEDKLAGARFEYEKRIAPNLLFRAGSDVWLDANSTSSIGDNSNNNNNNGTPPIASDGTPASGSTSDTASSSPSSNGLLPPRKDLTMGVWTDVVYKPTSRVEIVPGVRFDYFGTVQDPYTGSAAQNADLPSTGSAAAFSFDPRIATRVRIKPWLTSVEQVAVSHQPPSVIVPVPGLQFGTLKSGLQAAYTISQGFEFKLPWDFSLNTTIYDQRYTGLTDLITSCFGQGGIGSNSSAQANCLDERVRGRSDGLEILLRRSLTKRFTGWLSYTLSWTTRETNAPNIVIDFNKLPINPGAIGGSTDNYTKAVYAGTIPGEYDRRHVLNAIGAFDLGRGFRAGARFVFYTGTPYSQTAGGIPIPPYNGIRLPDFWRIDFRIEKRWTITSRKYVSAVLEWMNASLQKEAVSAQCTEVPGKLLDSCAPLLIGPVTIPSIGLEGAF